MKKKAVIFTSLVATLLVGVGITSYVLLQDNFSFSNLTVDISQSNGLGVGNINDSAPLNGRRNQSGSTDTSEFNKLIKVNENGELEVIRFYNENQTEVQIPFHPILIENYGDFTYIAYSDWPAEYHGISSSYTTFKSLFYSSYNQEAWNRDKFFTYEFVGIHKESGKVFDLKESIINQHTQSKTLSSTLVYLPDGFAYTTDPSQNDNQVCINRGEFNPLIEVIDMSVVCTDVIAGFENSTSNSIALPNGDIKLSQYNNLMNQVINLYSLETYDITQLSETDPRIEFFESNDYHYISSSQISWMKNDGTSNFPNILNTLTYSNGEFTLNSVEAPRNGYHYSYAVRSPYSSAEFVHLKINFSEDQIDVDINKVDPITLNSVNIVNFNLYEYEPNLLLDSNISLVHHFYDNKLFIIKLGIKPFIYEVDLETELFSKIFSSKGNGYFQQEKTRNPNFFLLGEEFYFTNEIETFKRTGNFYFSEISSLVETKYKFNIYNKQTYTESQSTPTFSYFETTPIN